jgi:hypothetical protein
LRVQHKRLEREVTYQLLKYSKLFEGYRRYILQGGDQDTKRFHTKRQCEYYFLLANNAVSAQSQTCFDELKIEVNFIAFPDGSVDGTFMSSVIHFLLLTAPLFIYNNNIRRQLV